MKEKIESLVTRLTKQKRWSLREFFEAGLSPEEISGLRRAVYQKFDGAIPSTTRDECLSAIVEWLGVTIAVSGPERVSSVLKVEYGALVILHLEVLVSVLEDSESSRERMACLETIVDLLTSAWTEDDPRFRSVRDSFVAAFLLASALYGRRIEYFRDSIKRDVNEELLSANFVFREVLRAGEVQIEALTSEARQAYLA